MFLSLLAKAALAYLPTALSVALRPPFPFQLFSTLFFSVCSNFSAKTYAILKALCWSRKHQQAYHFCSYLILALLSPLCPLLHLSFYLNLYGRSGKNYLLTSPVLSSYNGFPDTRFSRGTTWPMSWLAYRRDGAVVRASTL